MNFTLLPSLEHIALVKVSTSLWDKTNINNLASQNDIPSVEYPKWDNYKKIEDVVINKVKELPLPEKLKKELPSFIKSLGRQMWTWLHFRNGCFNLNLKGTVKFFWTLRGTLDTKKTAKLLVEDEDLDFNTRCRIAGIYCLEHEYYSLCAKFKKVHESSKLNYMGANDQSFGGFVKSTLQAEFHVVGNQGSYIQDLVCMNEYMFYYAALAANEAATRHMLRTLTPEEKEKLLANTAGVLINKRFSATQGYQAFHESRVTNVLCCLLSFMSESQQMTVYKKNPFSMALSLLNFPWQYLFLDLVKLVETALTATDYLKLVTSVCEKITAPYEDYDYECLLQMFWQRIPKHIKIDWFEDSTILSICLVFLRLRDDKFVQLVLNDIFLLKGKDFVFESIVMKICINLISHDRWNLFTLLITNIISKDSLIKFQEQLKGFFHPAQAYEMEASKAKWERCCILINECIQSFKKSETEEEDQSAKLPYAGKLDQRM